MNECDLVRVVSLTVASRPYSATPDVGRPPAIGDTGAVVHAFPGGDRFTVEAVTTGGTTMWLADFSANELELVDRGRWRTRRRPDVEAGVTFLSTSDGGRKTPALSGYRPAHRVRDDYFTSGTLQFLGVAEAAPGTTVRAFITFLTPEAYPRCLWIGKVIDVHEGSRIVARATILKVFNETLLGPG